MADYRTAYVYAGGSMSGLTLAESKGGWRADFARLLKKRKGAEHIHILSPNRSEPRSFKGVFATDGAGMPVSVLTRDARAVLCKDSNDIDRCELFLAGFIDAGDLISGGTFWEAGYAYGQGKPILTIGNYDNVNVSHLLLNGSSDFHADTVAEAVRAAVLLLTPGF